MGINIHAQTHTHAATCAPGCLKLYLQIWKCFTELIPWVFKTPSQLNRWCGQYHAGHLYIPWPVPVPSLARTYSRAHVSFFKTHLNGEIKAWPRASSNSASHFNFAAARNSCTSDKYFWNLFVQCRCWALFARSWVLWMLKATWLVTFHISSTIGYTRRWSTVHCHSSLTDSWAMLIWSSLSG